MKIGTLACWLFGHKFIGNEDVPAEQKGFKGGVYTKVILLQFCVRCGIDKHKGGS